MELVIFYGICAVLIVYAIVNRINKSKEEKFEDRDN